MRVVLCVLRRVSALSVMKRGPAEDAWLLRVANRVVIIGAWSLLRRSSRTFQLLSSISSGEQNMRSMCVRVLCLLRCVGEPSLSSVLPLLLLVGEPHVWCQLLKSPVRIWGLFVRVKTDLRCDM